MACGCSEICNCFLIDSETIDVTGEGTEASPWLATVIPDPAGGLTNTAAGVAILIDPLSEAPISTSAAGLKVDCCGGLNAVDDTDSVDLTMLAGVISADVIPADEGGLEIVPGVNGGVGIAVDPASTADVSTSAAGLLVNLPADPDVARAAFPVGSIIDYVGLTVPTGWEFCQGQTVSQFAYPQLYALIGTTFGPDTGGNFTLPDFRGRPSVGIGAHPDNNAMGDNDGLAAGSRTDNHQHSVPSLPVPALTIAPLGVAGSTAAQRTNTAADQVTGVSNNEIQEADAADLTENGNLNLTKAQHDHHIPSVGVTGATGAGVTGSGSTGGGTSGPQTTPFLAVHKIIKAS